MSNEEEKMKGASQRRPNRITNAREQKIKWPKDCCLNFKEPFMRAEIYDRTSLKFKVLLVASIGLLATVIALGELGII